MMLTKVIYCQLKSLNPEKTENNVFTVKTHIVVLSSKLNDLITNIHLKLNAVRNLLHKLDTLQVNILS